MPRRAPVPHALSHGPFTTAMAAAAGVPARRLRNGGFVRLARDVYVVAGTELTLEVRSRAALLAMPAGSVMSHWSALALLGLADPAAQRVLHVTPPPEAAVPRHREGIRIHQRTIPSEPMLVRDIPVAGAARTMVDMAPLVRSDRLVVIGDQVVRRAGGLDALVTQMAREAGQRHVVKARAALALVREGVDSPPETLLRLAIVRFGLPEPEVDVPIYDEAGAWLGRGELVYRKLRILIQYEGDVHRTNPRRWRQDIARDESYHAAGWRTLRATAQDLARPTPFCVRLEHARREALATLPTGDLDGTAA